MQSSSLPYCCVPPSVVWSSSLPPTRLTRPERTTLAPLLTQTRRHRRLGLARIASGHVLMMMILTMTRLVDVEAEAGCRRLLTICRWRPRRHGLRDDILVNGCRIWRTFRRRSHCMIAKQTILGLLNYEINLRVVQVFYTLMLYMGGGGKNTPE